MRLQNFRLALLILASLLCFESSGQSQRREYARRLLYVAAPGIRDYLEYGGHGILVFDINDGHKFIKRIPAAETAGLDEKGKPVNVKGICACAAMQRLYITTTRTISCFDMVANNLLWEKAYEG